MTKVETTNNCLSSCAECPKCVAGQICNPENGNCECPRFTEGPNCSKCKPYSWGYNKDTGCKLCNCTVFGSIDALTCHSKTGQCRCKPNFMGRRCELCNSGFFGPGKCDRCQCEPRGTKPENKVANALFNCDFVNGQCICKENVEGKNCDKCKNGTFGLSASYEKGCIDCYCSGVSKVCSRAKGWVLESMNQRLEITQAPKLSSRRSEPILMPAKTKLTQKVSWDMSGNNPLMVTLQGLKGDLTTTYGSVILEVTVRCEPTCGRASNEESFLGEATIVSWNRYVIKMNPEPSQAYHQSKNALGVTQDKYLVNMKEKFWFPIKDGDREIQGASSLSRDWLMFLLSNVTSFSIRATTGGVKPLTVR